MEKESTKYCCEVEVYANYKSELGIDGGVTTTFEVHIKLKMISLVVAEAPPSALAVNVIAA